MPKLPGRESTRKTIAADKAAVASFLMPWEDKVAKAPCCIEGCTHLCSGREQGDYTYKPYEPCSRGNAAAIYDQAKMDADHKDPFVGFACPHCVDRILDLQG